MPAGPAGHTWKVRAGSGCRAWYVRSVMSTCSFTTACTRLGHGVRDGAGGRSHATRRVILVDDIETHQASRSLPDGILAGTYRRPHADEIGMFGIAIKAAAA